MPKVTQLVSRRGRIPAYRGAHVLRLFSPYRAHRLAFPVPRSGQYPLIPGFVIYFKLFYWVPVKALWDNETKKLWPGGISFLHFGKLGAVM